MGEPRWAPEVQGSGPLVGRVELCDLGQVTLLHHLLWRWGSLTNDVEKSGLAGR